MTPPARTPIPIAVEGNATVVKSADDPIILQGSGTIRAENEGDEVVFDHIEIASGSHIIAEKLQVKSYLKLKGESGLSGADDTEIKLVNNQVHIVFEGEGTSTPSINLGQIGDNYAILPRKFEVNIRASQFEPEELKNFDRELVVGTTLSNCDDWITRTTLSDPDNFDLYCQDVGQPESESGAALLQGVTRALKIRPKSPVVPPITQTRDEMRPPSDLASLTEPSPNKLGAGAVAGIVIGVLVVLVAGVGAIYYVRRKKSKEEESGSEEESADVVEERVVSTIPL
jgi:hypothetical protein